MIEESDIKTPEELFQEQFDAIRTEFRAELDTLKSATKTSLESITRRLNMTDRWKDTQAGRLGHLLQEVQVLRGEDKKLSKEVEKVLAEVCVVQEALDVQIDESRKLGEQFGEAVGELRRRQEMISRALQKVESEDIPRLSELLQDMMNNRHKFAKKKE